MPIYAGSFTVPASSTQKFTYPIEGDYITKARIRFPPGPQALVKVGVFYGIKKIFPQPEDAWFQGDDEIIEWDEFYELPERNIDITVTVINEDDTYEHTVFGILVVRDKSDLLDERIGKSVRERLGTFLRRLSGWI